MSKVDPIVHAAALYAEASWDADAWRDFGRQTGCSDILTSDSRLYRAIGFNDPDVVEAAMRVLPKVLAEGAEGLSAQLRLLANAMPDLVTWTRANAPYRTQKLFGQFLSGLPADPIPEEWETDFDPSSLHAVASQRPTAQMGNSTTKRVAAQNGSQGERHGISVNGSVVMATKAQEGQSELIISNGVAMQPGSTGSSKIFIVHGHDHTVVREVQVFVHRITGEMPEILADLPGSGATIIEKFERTANAASYAIVLLTPDDEGRVKSSTTPLKPRARQNVVLELGYFFGKLGRDRVAVLDAGVEQPSDVHGLSYISYPGLDWKEQLRAELEHAQLLQR